MIIFLSKLDEMKQTSSKGTKFLYSKADTSNYHDVLTDVYRQNVQIKVFFTPDTHLKLHISSEYFIKSAGSKADSVRFNLLGTWKNLSVEPMNLLYKLHKNGITVSIPKNQFSFKCSYTIHPGIYHQWIQGLFVKVFQNEDSFKFRINSIAPPFGTRTWLMCKDTPYDKIDTLKMQIQVPAGYVAVANGRLLQTEKIGDSIRYEFETDYPLATYLIGLNIGKYQTTKFIFQSEKEGLSYPVILYFSRMPEKAILASIENRIKDILLFFESRLGTYPFYKENLKIVESNYHGGMENQTVIGVQEISLEKEYLIAHEIAHQWFGDFITPDFHDSWLSEGFATYLTALYKKEKEGQKAFEQYMSERKILKELPVYNIDMIPPDTVYSFERVYSKGSWILYQLHQWLGDKLFYSGIRKWLRRSNYAIVKTADFENTFLTGLEANQLKDWFHKIYYKGWIPECLAKIEKKDQKYYLHIQLKDKRFTYIPLFLYKKNKIHRRILFKNGEHITIGPFRSIEEGMDSFSSNFIKFHIIYP
jgi:hypothetical protein